MIATRTFGGDGPPVLLLHGAGGTADDVEDLARRLGRFSTVAVDLPGHGGSDDGDWTWDAVLDRLEEVVVGNPAVVGHSLGGMLAVRWARRHPGCPAVVNLDGNGWPTTFPGLSSEEVAARRAVLDDVFRVQEEMLAAPLTVEQAEGLVAQQPPLRRNLVPDGAAFRLRPGQTSFAAIRGLIRDTRTRDLYEGLTVPTLAVVATRLFPAQEPFADLLTAQRLGVVAELATGPGRARREVVEIDATHGMLVEAPERVAALVDAFLTDTLGR